jgi:uncharacterized membrane protein YdjX (TVP38/TMEM64 family)
MMTKWAILLCALLLVLVACIVIFPLEQFLVQVQQWAIAYPALAGWIVAAAFLLGAILLLPVSPIVMLAGFLFGLLKGFALIWVTGLLASSLAFWIGRSSARGWVENKLKDRITLTAIDRAIGRSGLWLVLLTRLAMVFPYAPLNYSFGLSSVRYRDYFVGTTIGMIPPFLLAVYLGTFASSVADVIKDGFEPEGHSLLFGLLGLAIAALAVAVLARSAANILREKRTTPESSETQAAEVKT